MSVQRLTAWNGSKHINSGDGAQTGVGCYGFIAQEDTVINVLLGGSTDSSIAENFKTTLGLTGKTLKSGALIVVPLGQFINSITLTSGSIIVYYSE